MCLRVREPRSWTPELRLFDEWLRQSRYAPTTRKLRNYQLRRFAAAVKVSPGDVTRDDVLGFLDHPTWSGRMASSTRAALVTFYSWQVDRGALERSPVEALPRLRVGESDPRIPASDSAIEAALERAGDRVALMIRLGAYMGLRCCEIATVNRSQVVDTPNGPGLRVIGKGAKVRLVPIPPDLRAALTPGEGYLFEGDIGGHVSAAHVSKLISRALPAGVTAHSLRHRYATTAYRRTTNLRAVQMLLGHSSLATTQIYLAVDQDALWETALAAA